jgi:AraC-like DNA-binding protein
MGVVGDGVPGWLHFSTDALPERDRFPVFCEEIMRRYAALDIVPRGDGPFRGVIEMQRAGVIDVSSRFTTPMDYVRSQRFVGDGNDSLFVVLCRSGGAYQCQLGRDVKIDPGDAVLCDAGYAGGIYMTVDSWFSSVRVPRARITKLLPRINRLAGAKLDRDDVARRLLFGYLDGTLGVGVSDGSPALQLYGEHIIDLIALALGAEGEGRELVERRSMGAVRRAAILREIERRIQDPDLAESDIAKRLRIAPRYLRLLLEPTGLSFSQHVLEMRLARANQHLRDPRQCERKIAGIAFECGFADLSYFNRAFLRRYGATPVRRARGGMGTRSRVNCGSVDPRAFTAP